MKSSRRCWNNGCCSRAFSKVEPDLVIAMILYHCHRKEATAISASIPLLSACCMWMSKNLGVSAKVDPVDSMR